MRGTEFFAQAAGYAADLADCSRALAHLLTVTGNYHHILGMKWNHLYQVSRASFRAGRTASALLIVNDSQAVNHMQSIKLARPRTIAKAQTSERTSLHISQRVCSDTGLYALIFRIVRFISGASMAAHDWSLLGA